MTSQEQILYDFLIKEPVTRKVYSAVFGLLQIVPKGILDRANLDWEVYNPGTNFPVLILHKRRKVFGGDDTVGDVLGAL